MSSDFIFRKAAFGGFNRDDVLAYIAQLKQKEQELEAALQKEQEENQTLRQQNDALRAEYEESIATLEAGHNEELSRIQNEYEEALQNAKNEALAERSAEERVGSAMLDVRRYADLLLHETCEKIDKMSDDADSAAAKTLARIFDISSGIRTFSDKLNSILKDLVDENEQICRELTDFKGSLRLPFEEASEKVNAEILGD